MSKKAFTLIEIIIVISLIAVFSVMAQVSYTQTQKTIEFGNVYTTVAEMLKEARNYALISKVDVRTQKVPFAYGVYFDSQKKESNFFIDALKTGNSTENYIFDEDSSTKDLSLNKYALPMQYKLAIRAVGKLSNLSDKTVYVEPNIIIGFMPPFGETYISAPKNPLVLYNKVEIAITRIETGASKYFCLNSIGGMIEEKLSSCF